MKRRDPRAEADRLVDIGIRADHAGDSAGAVKAYKRALEANPVSLDAHMNLGVLLTKAGHQRSAIQHLKRALSLAPKEPKVAHDAAWGLLQLGRWDLAQPVLERMLAARPKDAAALAMLAFLHLENGQAAQAAKLARAAVEVDRPTADAYFVLHCALYDDRDPAASLDALKQAVKLGPDNLLHRFHLGVLLDQCGDPGGAQELFDGLNGAFAGGVDSWGYVKGKRTASTRLFSTTRSTLIDALDRARPDGSALEFGVRYAISTRWIAEKVETLHGFDSFEGLPEEWHVQPKGAYSTHGETPDVPANVKLHIGWFDATIPAFAKENQEPIRFMNVDCDLYSSTKVIFDELASRIGPGTVIVFDEYIVNDRWRLDEFKAFQEAAKENDWRYEYLAFNLRDFQGSVRIC